METTELWDERARTWDRPESRMYAEQAFGTLQPFVEAHLGPWEQLRVLDFGAGTGLLTERLAPLCREVVALDISPQMLRVLDAKVDHESWTNVTGIAGELEALSQTRAELRQPFDLIVASSVCSFLPDFPAEVVRISSLLRAGGCFVQWDWRSDGPAESARGLTQDDIETAYSGASLDLVFADVGFRFALGGNELEVLQAVGLRRMSKAGSPGPGSDPAPP